MKSYSKLSACPRPGARHVLSLRYSLSCSCSLLLSYLYNKACHSLCHSFICVQFKGSPSEVWFSPCQDLVCAAVLWAVTSFWLSIIQCIQRSRITSVCSLKCWVKDAEQICEICTEGSKLYLQAVLNGTMTVSFPFKTRAQNIWNRFPLNA